MKKSTYIIIALLLGGLGIHKFADGKLFGGLLCIAVTCVSVGALGWLLPVIHVLAAIGKPVDRQGYFIR